MDIQAKDDAKLLRFVFIFWGSLRQSLASLGWQEAWDHRNTSLRNEQPAMPLSAFLVDKNTINQSALGAIAQNSLEPMPTRVKSAPRASFQVIHRKKILKPITSIKTLGRMLQRWS